MVELPSLAAKLNWKSTTSVAPAVSAPAAGVLAPKLTVCFTGEKAKPRKALFPEIVLNVVVVIALVITIYRKYNITKIEQIV